MQPVYKLADANPPGPTIVAVGIFDGIHQGHRHLLQRLVTVARARNYVPTVLTFFPHPDLVLGRASGRYYLMSPEERVTLLGALGVECVVMHPFDDQTRQIRAADFVDQLLAHLRLRELWVGADFALGYQREGDVAFLRTQGESKGFKLEVVDLVTNDDSGKVVNSSTIRAALISGDIETANRRLGRPYRLQGEVVRGEGRGRTIGFPTANIDVWAEQLLPPHGVYAGRAYLNGEMFNAVANMGNRPTFDGKTITVEVHILDFDRDIYGENLIFDVFNRLRPELKFNSVDELIAQIKLDVLQAHEVMSFLPDAG